MQCDYINKFSERCNKEIFKDLESCILHCSEEKIYNSEDRKERREYFYNLFSEYVYKEVKSKLEEILTYSDSLTIAELDSQRNDSRIFSDIIKGTVGVEISSSLQKNLRKIDLIVDEIKFPNDINMESLNDNVKTILKKLGRVIFRDCEFNSSSMNLYSEFYYEQCAFQREVIVNPFPDLKDDNRYRYKYCDFKSNVKVINSNHSKVIKSNLFDECLFSGKVSLYNVEIYKNLFRFPDFNTDFIARNKNHLYLDFEKHYNVKELLIKACSFELKTELNGFDKENIDDLTKKGYIFEKKNLTISKISIIDSKFKSKLEIKNRIVEDFKFKNSNVEKIFDVFGSRFYIAYFHKSIFKDFTGFERVHFGKKDNYDEKYIAKFIYTTFMSFSNFRETVFHSGLDFERVNLKENPNFLNAVVSQKNTKRESFRIIKHSFDSTGNQIEANRFFKMEMKSYKLDLEKAILKESDCKTKSELLVLQMNECLSDFGTNYIRPIRLLIVITIPYAVILYIHKYIYYYEYKAYYKFIDILGVLVNGFANGFQPISRFLVPGMEFFSLIYYIAFSILLWQIIVSIKTKVKR